MRLTIPITPTPSTFKVSDMAEAVEDLRSRLRFQNCLGCLEHTDTDDRSQQYSHRVSTVFSTNEAFFAVVETLKTADGKTLEALLRNNGNVQWTVHLERGLESTTIAGINALIPPQAQQ